MCVCVVCVCVVCVCVCVHVCVCVCVCVCVSVVWACIVHNVCTNEYMNVKHKYTKECTFRTVGKYIFCKAFLQLLQIRGHL